MGFIEFNVIMVIMAGLAAVAAYFISSSSHWRQRAEVAERELSTINHTAFDAMANRAGSKPAFSEQKPLPEATAGFKTGSQLKAEAHQQRVKESRKISTGAGYYIKPEMMGDTLYHMIYNGSQFISRHNTPETAQARLAELLGQSNGQTASPLTDLDIAHLKG